MICLDQILNVILKVTTIAFYVVVGRIAILTYRAINKKLRNAVNTEYQKKVINRLDEIAKELSSEFSATSPSYWAKKDPIKEMVAEINEVFNRQKEYILEIGTYPSGILETSTIKRLRRLLTEIESDPFVPVSIRTIVTEFLTKRIKTLSDIYVSELDSYSESLVNGKPMLGTDGDDPAFDEFHNNIVKKLNEEGCGITEIEAEVHRIRFEIQKYFDRFNPIES